MLGTTVHLIKRNKILFCLRFFFVATIMLFLEMSFIVAAFLFTSLVTHEKEIEVNIIDTVGTNQYNTLSCLRTFVLYTGPKRQIHLCNVNHIKQASCFQNNLRSYEHVLYPNTLGFY